MQTSMKAGEIMSGEKPLSELLHYIDPETFLDYEGIDYRRSFGSSGSQLNLKTCPRCGGSEWKVYLNADTGLGNCFHGACVGEPGFNLYSYSRHLWGLGARETIERLERYAKQQGWIAKREKSHAVMDISEVNMPASVPQPYKDKLLTYLKLRGISAKLAEYFHLRYCHEGKYTYIDHEGKSRWQKYNQRVLIPIYDLDGDLRTFQGRDITGKAEKKYLFPNGLPGTARFLYNAFNVTRMKEVVLCEGVFDVIAVKIAFDEDVALRNIGQVGSFGKHLSSGSDDGNDQLGVFNQLRHIGLERVVVMYDGESSALRAAVDAANALISIGLDVRVAILPDKCDPNEVSPDVVRAAYYQAKKVSDASLYKAIIARR